MAASGIGKPNQQRTRHPADSLWKLTSTRDDIAQHPKVATTVNSTSERYDVLGSSEHTRKRSPAQINRLGRRHHSVLASGPPQAARHRERLRGAPKCPPRPPDSTELTD